VKRFIEGRHRNNETDTWRKDAGAMLQKCPNTDRPLRVLVVDDDRDTADSTRKLAELWGYEAHVAYDGAEALKCANTLRPDVLLVDLGMPGFDGNRLARKVCQTDALQRCVLVAVSGYADSKNRAVARDAGFVCFLAKPCDPDFLQTLLSGFEGIISSGGEAENLRHQAERLAHELVSAARGLKRQTACRS
jgi:CheY-like chemotaxis protein